MNLPENYVVNCKTKEETNEVLHSIDRYKNFIKDYFSYWEYVCIVPNDDNVFSEIENLERWFKNQNIFEYTTFSFKEWKEIKEQKEFPKKWQIRITTENKEILEKWRMSAFPYNLGWVNSEGGLWSLSKFDIFSEEITIEEFKIHVLKENSNKTMQKLTITITELLEIHKIACTEWKSKIANYLTRVDEKQNVTFKQEEIDGMFKAATGTQKPVLIKIFGEQNVIKWDNIKTGSKVMLKHSSEIIGGTNSTNYDEPFDVVFWKTTNSIDCKNTFRKMACYNIVSTFHQNGKYIRFDAEVSMDYIFKVIEY